MKTYYIDYYDLSGDLCHIWLKAEDPEDAKRQAQVEYWDIQKIINVKKA